MSTKVEKYHNFIVKDLLEKTEVNERHVFIDFKIPPYPFLTFSVNFFTNSDIIDYLEHDLRGFIVGLYGARYEEIKDILSIYVKEVKKIIYDEY